jgi:hypothetical protein
MAKHAFSASALIQSPPQRVYGIIADYHAGHPRILPKPPFVSLEIEQGGIGTGTVIRVRMKMLGKLQSFRAVITEPDPGHVLVESNDTGYVTTFTVEPREDGRHSLVTIATEFPERTGVSAALERWLVKKMLLPVFERELKQLEEVAVAEAA